MIVSFQSKWTQVVLAEFVAVQAFIYLEKENIIKFTHSLSILYNQKTSKMKQNLVVIYETVDEFEINPQFAKLIKNMLINMF